MSESNSLLSVVFLESQQFSRNSLMNKNWKQKETSLFKWLCVNLIIGKFIKFMIMKVNAVVSSRPFAVGV